MKKTFLFIIFFVIKYFRFQFIFCVKSATLAEKSHPFFPNIPLFKLRSCKVPAPLPLSPPFSKFGRRFNIPSSLHPSRKGRGGTQFKKLRIITSQLPLLSSKILKKIGKKNGNLKILTDHLNEPYINFVVSHSVKDFRSGRMFNCFLPY